jgi:hypothetical protein
VGLGLKLVPRKASKGVFTLGVRDFSVHDFLSKLDDIHMVWNTWLGHIA